MPDRLSPWKLAEMLGKRRATALQPWVEWGAIPPLEGGTWPASVEQRARRFSELQSEARALDRRVLLLHRDGDEVNRISRRRALAAVLMRMPRKAHRMSRVLAEYDAFGHRSGTDGGRRRLRRSELGPDAWPKVVDPSVSSDALFDRAYQWCATFAPSVASAGAGLAGGAEEIPYEERLALLLVVNLVEENHVRNRLGLERRAPAFTPPVQ